MKRKLILMLSLMITIGAGAQSKKGSTLTFDATKGEPMTLIAANGSQVKYTAYRGLYYVTNIEDSTYQYMNICVPEGATQETPIFMPNNVGGYMAATPSMPDVGDASGVALSRGYVVAIAGARGRNSMVTLKTNGNTKTVYTGRAPKGLLDLKAAVRYLRLFDKEMLGNAEKIITNGTSAGGAMSALLGATGNNPAYEPYLKAMGAAATRDDVFASVCFCPIIDLDHADMAYEWLFSKTDNRKQLSEELQQVSKELAEAYPAYFNSLGLRKPDGTSLTTANLIDYIKSIIIENAQFAKDAGATIPDTVGFTFSATKSFNAPINGGITQESRPPMMRAGSKKQGEFITDLDMEVYLNYVVSTQPLKTVPAFDTKGVMGQAASGENEEFGDDTGSSVNFTDFSAAKTGASLSPEVKEMVRLMNPLNFIGAAETKTAQHWYIRHGAIDRDTAFPVPVILATKLQNAGKEVNFRLPWNRPHSGDYSLGELFEWIETIVKTAE